MEIFNPQSPNRDKYASKFKFDPGNYSYHITAKDNDFIITLNAIKGVDGVKHAKIVIDKRTRVPTSILEGRPALEKEVMKIAEVAGYLWQNGWAERNGGNITVNITKFVDDEIRQMPAISEVKQIGVTLPLLKGNYFYCKGTGKRMRDLARWPMDNGSVIRILDDCASYVIIADNPVQPTSELPSHLTVHNHLIEKGSAYNATVHTHPIELVAMSHNAAFLKKDVLTNILWSMIPETKAFCPLGLGIIPYELPGATVWPMPPWHSSMTTMWCYGKSTAFLHRVST